MRGVSTVLIAAGLLMLLDAGLTVAWQEPVTALLAKLRQNQLSDDLRALDRTRPATASGSRSWPARCAGACIPAMQPAGSASAGSTPAT
jgi:hypothetical protein